MKTLLLEYNLLTNVTTNQIKVPIHEYWQHVESIIKIKQSNLVDEEDIYRVISQRTSTKLKKNNLPDAIIGNSFFRIKEEIQFKKLTSVRVFKDDLLLYNKINNFYKKYIIEGDCTLIKIDIPNEIQTIKLDEDRLVYLEKEFKDRIKFTKIIPQLLISENEDIIKNINKEFNSTISLNKERILLNEWKKLHKY